MYKDLKQKLKVLADAAKYDVSCASSGSNRVNSGGLGNTAKAGICHSYTEDGRCISLLKILFTNYCKFDCAYCINRNSNDIPRTAFTVKEVIAITINFYRRNYIEGLFLSSGIFKSADHTMEKLVCIVSKLRQEHHFNGYIHLKAIPGASKELLTQAGLYADRLSLNIELPSDQSLQRLAPGKSYQKVIDPMNFLNEQIVSYQSAGKQLKNTPKFTPAGQSTQLVIGASAENDHQILRLASGFYKNQKLKRVYYSGYIPVNQDNRLPALPEPPLKRENRLYQADWLMRFYRFKADEIVNDHFPHLDLQMDPKLSYALRNLHLFPLDINQAEYEMILRIPGVGLKSAGMIMTARKNQRVTMEHLKKFGVVWKRARFFICNSDACSQPKDLPAEKIKMLLIKPSVSKNTNIKQLNLFNE